MTDYPRLTVSDFVNSIPGLADDAVAYPAPKSWGAEPEPVHTVNDLTQQVAALDARIVVLTALVAETDNRVVTLKNQAHSYKIEVADALRDLVSEDDLDRETARKIADDLGIDSLFPKYDVKVMVEVFLRNVEADSERQAEERAQEVVDSADFSLTYNHDAGDDAEINCWSSYSADATPQN